ncbi:MAG: YncE family protein, partial [SAR324 cluster bacterium]|nr:YncE family protein [SAR324 cluster bacterium]
MKKKLKIMLTVSMLAGFLGGCVTGTTKMGAPTTGMSSGEYQSLLRLDPQNTLGSNFDAVRDTPGYFLIDNQGEPTVSVVDYHKGETIKKIQMGETGNHHIFVIPGARYAFSSQRYE